MDIDPQAILATHQNAALNNVSDRLKVFLPEEFSEYQRAHDLTADTITANILAKPLIEFAPLFSTLLKDGGSIVLAGLIENQTQSVIDAYAPYFELGAAYHYDNKDDHHWHRLSGIKK